MIRWLAAVIGFSFFRFPGAIVGFLLGSFFDNMNSGKRKTFRGPIFQQTRGEVTPADFVEK